MTGPAIPREAVQAAAREPCEHYWAFHCYGNLSVRLCQLCHEPDWDDLRGQLAEAERKGALAERERLAVLAGTIAGDALRELADEITNRRIT